MGGGSCSEIISATTSPVTINELLNYEPSPTCTDCLNCEQVEFTFNIFNDVCGIITPDCPFVTSNQYVPFGTVIWNPQFGCIEIIDVQMSFTGTSCGYSELVSFPVYVDCADCLSNPRQVWLGTDCVTERWDYILFTGTTSFVPGQIVQVQRNGSDYTCYNLQIQQGGEIPPLSNTPNFYYSLTEVPFNVDTVDSPLQVFIGKSLPSNSNSKPVFGVFFNRTEDSLRYRKIMSPGIETYSFSPVLVEENFGYPNSQVVPFYKWKVEQPASVIFGTEDNNWWTTPNQVANTGFYTKKYQSLDFETPNEKYRSTTTKLGYITNYNQNGVPSASSLNVVDGEPGGNPVLVGAPYHFYFGLYNGKTALDIFYKRYVQVQD